jgi:pimeloyl-ACP methyl ester carboxylesterase
MPSPTSHPMFGAVALAAALMLNASVAGAAPWTQAPATLVVPSPVPDVPSGTLLSSALSATPGPAGSKQYQVLYASRDAQGQPIGVSGFAFIPAGSAPKGGWPVLSYAHGTVGLADRCAPSRKVGAVEQLLALGFVAQGIAVVATDYEGLGTPGRHPYLVGQSEGRSVLDIVKASRQLPGETLSSRFAVWGHSQGGHAALFAGQLTPTWAPELKLVGVVAGAPPSQLLDVSTSLAISPSRGFLFMVAAGLNAADPSLNLDEVITPKAKALLPVVDTGCNSEVFRAFSADPLNTLLTPNGLSTGPWAAAVAANEPGTTRINAPVLLVHGDRDEVIPIATSAKLLSKMCAAKTKVQRRVFAGQDHTGAAIASIFDVNVWVSARFAGLPAATSCRR